VGKGEEIQGPPLVPEGTPVLRADATDDQDENEPEVVAEAELATATAEEKPKKMVPVVVGGVLHGYREED